jgi:ABC-type Fe3+-citrate transport system substrate-binding protein
MAQPKVSPDEQKAAQAIDAAPDAAGKAKAADDFVKKYPKSVLRPVYAQKIADQIRELTDGQQKITMAQQFKSIFNSPGEEEMILPVLIVGYADAKKPDDAFSNGTAYLGQHPDSVAVLVELMFIATDQAKQKNGKFVAQGDQYGTHAIELIEGNKKPASMDDATWKEYRDLLPRLYQSLGILGMVKGDRAATQMRLTKATELDPKDPFNYLLLSGSLNDDYQDGAKRYQTMKDGPEKTAELEKVVASLDRVIDAYAHFIALSEGNAQLATVRQQEMQDLEKYYKFRHNGKTDGMQELINKYKTPAAKPKDPFAIP